MIDVAGLTSIFATIVAATNSQSRILYNAGREGLLRRAFGIIGQKRHTPYVALLVYLGLAIVLAIVFGYKIGVTSFLGDATTLGMISLILM